MKKLNGHFAQVLLSKGTPYHLSLHPNAVLGDSNGRKKGLIVTHTSLHNISRLVRMCFYCTETFLPMMVDLPSPIIQADPLN